MMVREGIGRGGLSWETKQTQQEQRRVHVGQQLAVAEIVGLYHSLKFGYQPCKGIVLQDLIPL